MELLITVASLATAIYAVASRERRLDLRLRLGLLDVCVVGGLFLATLYLEFYGFAESHHFALSQCKWPHGLNPKNATYLTTLSIIAWVAVRLRTARFQAKNIFKFQELTEELFWGGRFGELLTLVENHAGELFRASQHDFRLARLARWLAPPPTLELRLRAFIEGKDEARQPESKESPFARFMAAARRRVAALLPTYERESEAANDIIRSAVLAPAFVKAMAVSRPYAALRILAQWPESADKNEFVFLYFSELVENVSSVFYTELARNQGMTAHGYEIPPTNRLLHFFLLDAKVAQQFRLYKPVGDFVERHLDELQRHPEQDFYNRMPGQFDDEERNRWPVYAAVRFFDIMITQALYQGIEWHMWLYYFPPFVERMLRNYQSDSGMFDPDAEFPLRYSKLLYEVFDVLRDWILALEYIPEAQRNTVLKNTQPTHENANIPKSSILALSICLRQVLESNKVGEGQKRSLTNMALELYFELRGIQRDNYASALVEALKAGGFSYRDDDALYQKQLRECLRHEQSEYEIKYQQPWVDDLCAALGIEG